MCGGELGFGASSIIVDDCFRTTKMNILTTNPIFHKSPRNFDSDVEIFE